MELPEFATSVATWQNANLMPEAETRAKKLLHAAGLRPTPARVRIVLALEAECAPMAADDVFRVLSACGACIGLGTVYRALGEMTSAGLVLRAWVPGGAGARAVYSVLVERRTCKGTHRLMCWRCGRSVAFVDTGLLERLRQAAGLSSLALGNQGLIINVECMGCAPCCT